MTTNYQAWKKIYIGSGAGSRLCHSNDEKKATTYASIYEFFIVYEIYACNLSLGFYKVSYKTNSNELHKLLFDFCRNNGRLYLA